MTSPVDTSVKYFSSSLLNSPVLTRLAGSLVALLNALLVDGYDTKAATATVANNVCTLAFAGNHSAIVGSVILVAGCDEAALNGEQKVTATDGATVKFATAGVTDGAKTGTITFKMAPLGWSKPFTGTNQAVYRSTAVGTNGHFLRVVDTAVGYANVTGYENMTTVSAGTGLFPTAAMGSGRWPKAFDPSDGTSPGCIWFLCGDSRTFYLGCSPYSAYNSYHDAIWVRGFGDTIPLRTAGDAFSTFLSAHMAGDTAPDGMGQAAIGTQWGLYTAMPRAYTGLGTAIFTYATCYEGDGNSISGIDNTHGSFPSTIDGALHLSPMRVTNQPFGQNTRADLPGIYWVPMSNTLNTFNTGMQITGTGFLAGKKLTAVRINHQGTSSTGIQPSTTGTIFFDTTGPWR